MASGYTKPLPRWAGAVIALGVIVVVVLALDMFAWLESRGKPPRPDAAPEKPARTEAARTAPRPPERRATSSVEVDVSGDLAPMTTALIRSQGLWCDGTVRMMQDIWKTTTNRRVFRVTCDSGSEFATYELVTDHDFNPISVREK